jgi:5'-nucleotidase
MTPDTKFLSSAGAVEFLDPAAGPVQAEVDKLVAAGADLIVGLSHTGYAKDQEMAAAIKNIDLIIGGHTHSYLATGEPANLAGFSAVPAVPVGPYPTVVQGIDGKNVYVVQSFWSGWFVGHITVTKGADGTVSVADTSRPVFMNSSIAMDSEMLVAMEPWLEKLGLFREEVIGESLYEMSGARSPGLRTQEMAMGNYIADALMYYAQTYRADLVSKYGNIDFVIQNGGGIRAGLSKGEILVANIMSILPFGNIFSIISLTGAKVLETLEHSVSAVEAAEGRFLQVAGIRFGFNQGQPVGSRIVFAHLETAEGIWVAVDKNKKYNTMCANYLAQGGDGFASLTSSELIFEYGNPLSDTVIEATKDWGKVDYPPESIGNRIMNCTATPDKCASAIASVEVTVAPSPAPSPSPAPKPVPAPSDKSAGVFTDSRIMPFALIVAAISSIFPLL